jgi:hypothetical protein
MHYPFRAYGSAEESIEHLELLFETNSLTDEGLFKELHDGYNQLAGKLLRYVQAVNREFDIPRFMKEPPPGYFFNLDTEDSPLSSQSQTPNP